MKATDFVETELEAKNLLENVGLNFKWFLHFLLIHQKIHHFLHVYAGQQEELPTTLEDKQNMPATDEDIHVMVGVVG